MKHVPCPSVPHVMLLVLSTFAHLCESHTMSHNYARESEIILSYILWCARPILSLCLMHKFCLGLFKLFWNSPPYGLKGGHVMFIGLRRWFCGRPHFPGTRQYIFSTLKTKYVHVSLGEPSCS